MEVCSGVVHMPLWTQYTSHLCMHMGCRTVPPSQGYRANRGRRSHMVQAAAALIDKQAGEALWM